MGVETWEKYLQYLKNWIEDHKNEMFLGCSPACFDEWAENEMKD